MNGTIRDIVLVFCFMVIGGLFAGAEMALVSLREGQIRSLAERGRRGQTVARLASEPNRFLSAVQVGVTFAGFMSAAFGAATLADQLQPVLVGWGVPDKLSDVVALVVVTLIISYFSIVLSELAAKRLALQRTMGIALAVAPTVDRIAKISKPLIWLLSVSTNAVVRLLGGDPAAGREQMSDEELRQLVSTHETLSDEERRIVEDVFSAGDRQLREVMVPRTEVDFLDASLPVAKAAALVSHQPHSRYPVIRASSDDILGVVHVRDLFDSEQTTRSVRIGELVRQTLLLPGTRGVLSAMADMRRQGVHLAIVVDEYGGTAGIVTLEDLVEELIGDIRDEYDLQQSVTTRLRGGDIELDGLVNLEDFQEETGLMLPDGPYETVAGFIIARLGHLPAVGEHTMVEGHRLSVLSLDGHRVDRIRVGLDDADRDVETPEGSPSTVPAVDAGTGAGPSDGPGAGPGAASGAGPGADRRASAPPTS